MKRILFIFLSFSISGCTLVGAILDNKAGTDDVDLFLGIGAAFDSILIESMFTHSEKKIKTTDEIACPEDGTYQVCTTTEGCWCEQI